MQWHSDNLRDYVNDFGTQIRFRAAPGNWVIFWSKAGRELRAEAATLKVSRDYGDFEADPLGPECLLSPSIAQPSIAHIPDSDTQALKEAAGEILSALLVFSRSGRQGLVPIDRIQMEGGFKHF